jgi:hypothetical protein
VSARKLKIRKLRASEVTFEVSVDPECESPEGMFASGDDEQDAADVKSILDAVEAGNAEAWCCITVKAEWEGLTGIDHLGGCSFLRGVHRSVQAQIDECVDDHGMREEALAALNAEVQRQAEKSLELIARLTVKPRKPAKKAGRK